VTLDISQLHQADENEFFSSKMSKETLLRN